MKTPTTRTHLPELFLFNHNDVFKGAEEKIN